MESGNYPLVAFETPSGEAQEWYPSMVAGKGSQRVFGWEAWTKQAREDWQKIRSLKRHLSQANPQTCLTLGEEEVPVLTLLVEYLSALRQDLLENSNLHLRASTTLEVMIGVPANANSNQRFLTLEGFRGAGFEVLGMINEPTAAGIEYAYRYRQSAIDRRREYLLIYDLGGGTFDLSVIQMSDRSHRVITTGGIECLGGDDFDMFLADLAIAKAGLGTELQSNFGVLEECREKKESLTPHTKKIQLDFGRVLGEELEVTVKVAEFEERCLFLVQKTIEAVDSIMTQASLEEEFPGWPQTAGLYIVGGAAALPLIPRMLKDRYGRRIRKSPYPRAATAIGLAIAGDEMAGYVLEDRFTRHFGVWREAEGGQRIIFDPVFSKDVPLPMKGEPPLVQSRRYEPVHNIGHFRYLECSHLDSQGQPTGDIAYWNEIRFPFDPALSEENHLEQIPVGPLPEQEKVQAEEIYTCDSRGIVKVTLINHTGGWKKSFQLRQAY